MADKKHEVVAELKRLQHELGRAPTRDDLKENSCFSKHSIISIFGTFTEAMKAAGLDKKSEKLSRSKHKEKVVEYFKRDIVDELNQPHQGVVTKINAPLYPIAVLPDAHFPFVCLNSLTAFYSHIERNKPKIVVQVGDLLDAYAFAKFPKSKNVYTPKQEIDLGRKMAEDMWRTIQRICPKVICYQLLGNHDARFHKRVMEQLPEAESLFNLEKLFEFPGVETIQNPRDSLIINGVHFIHGHLSRIGDHRDYFNANVVCGHSHRPGISISNSASGPLWEMNVGYIADPDSKALSYTSTKFVKWSKSFGWIDEDGPRVILV